ncbi:MAG: type II toxin-antitoxin system Phd/YefM family antitoxin [Pseudomonadota bacterium]|nr:type II toxin-antitoxin system Phd/YefM family antitoxin [Pseudomonadota bacterium]
MGSFSPIDLNEIHSLTDFVRHTKEHARRLKKTGRPSVLTVNGQAELVVQDARSYQRMLDLVAEAEHFRLLGRSLTQMEAGQVHDFEKTAAALRAEYFGKPAPGKRRQ